MKYLFLNKDISKIYEDIYISRNGEVFCNNLRSVIYQIIPISVIDINEDYRDKIYNAYYSCIKAMPENIQIISLRDNLDFSPAILRAKDRIKLVQSEVLKLAISKYIEKLQEISQDNSQTVLKHYVILPSNIQDYQVGLMYENLINHGMRVKKVTNIGEIKNIMRKCIKKENI